MASPVILPKLGLTMTEGTLTRWLVADGERVEKGQLIFEMSTEKIETEVEAEKAGIVRHLVAEYTTVPAGAVVGCLLAEGEEMPEEFEAMAGTGVGRAAAAAEAAEPRRVGAPAAAGPRPAPQTPPSPAPSAPAETEFRPVSPLARRLADELGVDLSKVVGSGPGGRIVKEDVERAAAASEAPAAAPPSGEVVPFRGMRRNIGERMHESLQTMAQLTITTEADVTEAVTLREQLVEEWQSEGLRPTYTDLVLKAAAFALTEHPRVNATLEGESIRLLSEVHVGLAVSLDEGLIVPVVRDADKKSLKQIAAETSDLSEKARANTLSVDDVTGGTFTVTSLGMYGVDTFTPIVTPRQAAILGVGRIREVPAFASDDGPPSGTQTGRLVRRSVMDLSLTFDHRLLDGAPAAQFLGRVRALLERPYLLLLQK
jgi:pyruvate dehydrogenase E2 component (dihydrolipoamide acetyltransferase)